MDENRQLEIPDEAWDAVVTAVPIDAVVAAKGSAWDINDLQQKAVEAAAPLIVAAELERMADIIDNAPYPLEELKHRAAELRGETR
jgi:hypothetical protein